MIKESDNMEVCTWFLLMPLKKDLNTYNLEVELQGKGSKEVLMLSLAKLKQTQRVFQINNKTSHKTFIDI